MSENLTLEKLYKKKFNEEIKYFSSKIKASKDILDLEKDLEKDETEKDGYKIIHPKRKLSLFDQKCKYCGKTPFKKEDKLHYLIYSCCTECFIIKEEGRENKNGQ
jgi:hypothetical protein